ncbi:NAD-dependent epimerase/dehydratase family protein [Echinicola sp. 20G]|uniref:NAD-dependent epimerase/dehydratase family protein n=1 Tax=Echinicola sp. 20G TaxID=2781961 RepID=UPI00190FC5F8|nr:NAD-dependent epimerase/dehydratase family protein [Echinicola sp. 20G]
MQTILGAGGIIANELVRELRTYTEKVRLVSRNPVLVNEADQTFSADLLDLGQTKNALKGSTVAYLTVGFRYKLKIWEKAWPKVMNNVIEACREENVKLVFFDNVYMYDPTCMGHMTEDTPFRPVSKKGHIRAKITELLLEHIAKGNIDALIARSADFYGPSISLKSILTEMVFKPLSRSNSAKWLADPHQAHSFTYTPDAGKATALLGNTPDAFNQTWHLPTASKPPTGKEWIHMVAKEMGNIPKYQVIPKWFFKTSGVFVPFMKELSEMIYQYDRPYIFDSSKFEELFFFKPTSYIEGIRRIIRLDHPSLVKHKDDLLYT